ncbi:MAG: hypothetical protein RIC80_00845 [Cyclobacteriaceae bacterium]
MTIRLVAIIGLWLMTTACQKDESLDLRGVEWLKERITEIEQSPIANYSYINDGEYKNDRVFIFGNCCPFCASLPAQVHNDSGELLGFVGTDIDLSQIKNVKLFWQPNDAVCIH